MTEATGRGGEEGRTRTDSETRMPGVRTTTHWLCDLWTSVGLAVK